MDALVEHVRNGIAAATAYTYDFDYAGIVDLEVELYASGLAYVVFHIREVFD